ncbi:MAG: hypothetical protein A2176_06220 [Spirochaetes bacterium RBG_13_51_14]|nr:MAG: hypothetical protein A2176_06220 [Spirochaetes bacterium RBG_13_51_14]
MIKLKNGHVIPYNKDFDIFFQELLESIVRESRDSAAVKQYPPGSLSRNEVFLKELMDNCIYVTHQLFDMAKNQEEFSRFIITGFIFNSIICCLPVLEKDLDSDDQSGDEGRVH